MEVAGPPGWDFPEAFLEVRSDNGGKGEPAQQVRFMKWLLIMLVRGYQIVISPVLHFVTGPFGGCRFTPTCSQYFIDAVRVHGAFKGGWMGICRIGRCHPWGGCGHDPVPGWEAFEKSHPEFAHRDNGASVGGSAADGSQDS